MQKSWAGIFVCANCMKGVVFASKNKDVLTWVAAIIRSWEDSKNQLLLPKRLIDLWVILDFSSNLFFCVKFSAVDFGLNGANFNSFVA